MKCRVLQQNMVYPTVLISTADNLDVLLTADIGRWAPVQFPAHEAL